MAGPPEPGASEPGAPEPGAPEAIRRQPRATPLVVTVALAATLLTFALALVPLPIRDGVPMVGLLLLAVIGGFLSWWGARLQHVLFGTVGGIAVAFLVTAAANRAFAQTAWTMEVDAFAQLFGLTILAVLGATVVGYQAVAIARRSTPDLGADGAGIGVALLVAIVVWLGAPPLAEAMQAVIPRDAVRVSVRFEADGVTITPATFPQGPTYWALTNVDMPIYDTVVVPFGSDEELARRIDGDMEGATLLYGALGVSQPGSSVISRSDFEPGRYVILFSEPLPDGAVEGGAPDDTQITWIPELATVFEVTD